MSLFARRFRSPIAVPAPRLLRAPRLRFVGRRGGGKRVLDFGLPLVSFVDCLLCLVMFLLASFGADAACPQRERVPSAENAAALAEAPIVAVTPSQILLDGVPAGSTREIVESGRLQRVDALFNQLRSKRELWRQLHPGEEFPGVAVLAIDRTVPSLVVKSTFQTAAYAGYPNVSFMVEKR